MGKTLSMHIEVTGAVVRVYHIQRALAQGGYDRAWLPPDFDQEIGYWKALDEQIESRPTLLDKIVRQEFTHMGFRNSYGISVVGV